MGRNGITKNRKKENFWIEIERKVATTKKQEKKKENERRKKRRKKRLGLKCKQI